MSIVSVTYASSPSSDLLIPTLEFNNEQAGVIRLAQYFNVVPQRKLQVVQDGASGTGPSGVGRALYTDA